MSSLQFSERSLLEKILGMRTGYVSDFSDQTFREFVMEKTKIDILAEQYAENGTSKANRLRTFLKKESNATVVALLEPLLEYALKEKTDFDRDLGARDERLFIEARKIVQKLKDESSQNPLRTAMKLVYPTKNEIIEFFRNHTGFHTALRISELLVAPHRNNVQEPEWRHIRDLLHELKSEGFLLVEKEGQDIYNEAFSSTPDKIKKYFEVSKGDQMLDSKQVRMSLITFLNEPKFQKRSFEVIKRRFTGLEDFELRNVLLSIGAMSYRGSEGEELWELQKRDGKDEFEKHSEQTRRADSTLNPEQPKIVGNFAWWLGLLRSTNHALSRYIKSKALRSLLLLILVFSILFMGAKFYAHAFLDTGYFSYQPQSMSYGSESAEKPEIIYARFQGDVRNISSSPRYLRNLVAVLWKDKSLGSTWRYTYSSDLGEIHLIDGASSIPISIPIHFEPNETKKLEWAFKLDTSGDEDVRRFLSERTCNGDFCWNKNNFDILAADSRGNIFNSDGILQSQKVIDDWWVFPNNRSAKDRFVASVDLFLGIIAWKTLALIPLLK